MAACCLACPIQGVELLKDYKQQPNGQGKQLPDCPKVKPTFFLNEKRKAKPEEAKTITIDSLETLDTNLRIKLKFDDITKFWFFNEYIKGYLLDDPLLQPFIEKIKETSMMARKHKLKKNRQLLEKEKEIKNKFGLDPDEIENIFDLIESEE